MYVCLGCMEEYNEKYNNCPYCGCAKNTPVYKTYHMVPGSILQGKYIVGKAIHEDGCGVTYIGKDASLNKKILIQEYLSSIFFMRTPGQLDITILGENNKKQVEQEILRFVNEAKWLSEIQQEQHFHQIYEVFYANNTAYIIKEYLEGERLTEILRREKKISVEQAIEIMVPLAESLDTLHESNIIHRNITPFNIFIEKEKGIKLLDFSTSCHIDVDDDKRLCCVVVPGYAPIEQYTISGKIGTWTDVYALAATLYRMLTGVVPPESTKRLIQDDLQRPSKLGVRISDKIESVIMNALQVMPEDRIQTMHQFVHELLR